jgi:hypothetical protein
LSNTVKEANSNPTFIPSRTGSVYEIHVQVKNLKNRSIKVEYTRQLYYSQSRLIKSTDDLCVQDGSFIKCKMSLNAGEEQNYSYNLELNNAAPGRNIDLGYL